MKNASPTRCEVRRDTRARLFLSLRSFEEMKSAPAIEKMKRGPVGFLTAAERAAGDGKEYGPMVFLLRGD